MALRALGLRDAQLGLGGVEDHRLVQKEGDPQHGLLGSEGQEPKNELNRSSEKNSSKFLLMDPDGVFFHGLLGHAIVGKGIAPNVGLAPEHVGMGEPLDGYHAIGAIGQFQGHIREPRGIGSWRS